MFDEVGNNLARDGALDLETSLKAVRAFLGMMRIGLGVSSLELRLNRAHDVEIVLFEITDIHPPIESRGARERIASSSEYSDCARAKAHGIESTWLFAQDRREGFHDMSFALEFFVNEAIVFAKGLLTKRE